LLVLAEIAGVFVGFGALIAVRGGCSDDPLEVAYLRSILAIGVWLVMIALTPIALGAYDIAEREVWLVSSLIALTGLAAVWAANYRTREMTDLRASAPRGQILREGATYVLLGVVILAALVFVMLGLFPEHEPALYLTAVVMGLFVAALSLLWLVFAHRGYQTTPSAEVGQPKG
jgi:hypothetical protein